MDERETIDRGWYYVKESDPDQIGPETRTLYTPQGTALTRRLHGSVGRITVSNQTNTHLSAATLLRSAAAVGEALKDSPDARVDVVLGPKNTVAAYQKGTLTMDGIRVQSSPSHHAIVQTACELVKAPHREPMIQPIEHAPSERILCFESLMNTDMPHNDRELSQGVLHMVSPLRDLPVEVRFANVKMSIMGDDRPVEGIESLDEALAAGPVDLVCITLLEGYFHGVVQLITALRERGCRAHIAVGGVMPSLAPEHVAAHLPDVSFICRGAGERFLPELVKILGKASIDIPLRQDQIEALTHMSGLIARIEGPLGQTLVSARSDQTANVDQLDRVALDLRHLKSRHIEGGIELSTSRGCIHKCTFCSIMGREQFQARSSGNVIELLASYGDRFAEMFGDQIPGNSYRVHICDDDFACDRERAKSFFEALPETPFKLSSVQVSVADLCIKENDILQPVPDAELLDTITRECFADASRNVPSRDFVLDHKSRNWSSFLQIGVETFSDAELVRLGKGYRVDHIRVVVDALAARGLHMDAYFIQSNADTTALDLIESLDELCRLKMAYPYYFHLRFPTVPHLVSYFTSSNYRRLVRQGRDDAVQNVLDRAATPNHPEYDYPFVGHDIPQDQWVNTAVENGFFTDEERYTDSYIRLRELWMEQQQLLTETKEKAQGERLIRQLDDRSRRRAFELLEASREVDNRNRSWRPGIPDWKSAFANATAILGPSQAWLPAFKRYVSHTSPRLVVIPTWQCELRCRYCFIPKQDGRVMTLRTLERSIDMLLASDRNDVILQFFGGEALLEWDLVQHAITYGNAQAEAFNKTLAYIISSNGWSIDKEKLSWLSQFNVKLELSLDGDEATQNKFRRALEKGRDSYHEGISGKANMIVESGIPHEVIMVVHPEAVDKMPDNFFHIVD
ncbi:MAG: radical SAM protein, partial [Myxococcota bacterium]